MKTQSKRKTSLKSSILILLLLAVLLVTSTYAWFTSNQTVTVSSLNVNVQAKNGLQLSVDGTNWKTVISNDDIKNAIDTYATAKNQIPEELEPVSTGKTVTNGFLDMFYGVAEAPEGGDGQYRLSATKTEEVNGIAGKFIAFDLFVKADAATTPIYFTNNSGVKFLNDDKGLKNAARMAFLIEGNLPSGSAVNDIQALKGATPAATSIWEPNYDVHTAAGVSYAKDTYDVDTETTGATAIAYSGIKAEITQANAVLLRNANATDSATYFANITPDFLTVNGAVPTETFTTLNAGITKIRVYMWVEGQDVDCENTASGTDVTFDLGFTLVK